MSTRVLTVLRLVALIAVWMLGLEVLGVGDTLIYLAPALLILLPLVFGRYPGDSALARATERVRARRVRTERELAPRQRSRARLLPRGGRLVGAALAVRGPPRVVFAPS